MASIPHESCYTGEDLHELMKEYFSILITNLLFSNT